jgi:hypothetical protein
MNNPQAAAMTGRRPRESEKYPASGDAINASKDVLLVIADKSKVDNGRPRSSCIETRVELITPVLFDDSGKISLSLLNRDHSLITK